MGLDQEEMVIAIPMEHRLAIQAEAGLSLADLQDEPFILYRQVNGSGIKEMLFRLCKEAGFEPIAVQEVHRVMAAIQLVAAGLGISVVPKSLSTIQPKSVFYRPFEPSDSVTVPLNLAFRRNVDAQAIKRFLSLSSSMAVPLR